MALQNAKFIFGGAESLGADISYKPGGRIESWAAKVLDETLAHLEMIHSKGLFIAIQEKAFAEVSRRESGGKGLDGVIVRGPAYLNPFFSLIDGSEVRK